MPLGSHMSVVSNATNGRVKGGNAQNLKAIVMEDMLTLNLKKANSDLTDGILDTWEKKF